MNLPSDKKVDLEKFVDGHRNILQVEKEKALFIGLAWVLPMEQKFFHHFPEVICVDTVSHTNKDKRPLLTISGKDSYGKMFIILRAFLPNERAWVFRWIFSIVMPTLFPGYILSKVKSIITDGCPQEFMQIDIARQNIFNNALRVRCGFHLVRMGWTHHIMKKHCFPTSVGCFYDRVCNHLNKWMYSWMKSSCETREEYLVSKLMFKKFLNSKPIKTKLGTTFIQNVESFVTKHIEPHETYFCFYLRLNLRSFEEYTNSIHEGTNRGLKYNSAPVGPSTNIEKALAIMCNNAERSVTKKKKIASKDFRGSKMYSQLKCSNKIVPIADSILFQNWKKRLCYKSIKISSMKWLVTYDVDNESHEESKTLSPLPRFKRVRKVYFEDGCLFCSCKHRQRYGIDCGHIFHIMSQAKDFEEPNHHHISVRWWNSYYQVACLSSTNDQFDALEKGVKLLMMNEKDGLQK